jgi:hypothetical protein
MGLLPKESISHVPMHTPKIKGIVFKVLRCYPKRRGPPHIMALTEGRVDQCNFTNKLQCHMKSEIARNSVARNVYVSHT